MQTEPRDGTPGPGEPIDVTPPPGEPIDVTPPAAPFFAGSADPDAADGDPPSPRRRRVRLIALGVLLTASVVGLAFAGTAGWRIMQQKDATLTTPPEVAGLRLDESERAASTADYLRTAIGARIDLDESIGVVYADPASADRSILLFGGTTLLWSPEKDLDTLFDLLSDDTGAVTGLHEVDAGELDGVMKCGESASPEGNLTVCGWADHGSVVIGMFPGRAVDESATLLRTVRGTIQSRS